MDDDRIVSRNVTMWQSTWSAVEHIASNVSEAVDSTIRARLGLPPQKHPRTGPKSRTGAPSVPRDEGTGASVTTDYLDASGPPRGVRDPPPGVPPSPCGDHVACGACLIKDDCL